MAGRPVRALPGGADVRGQAVEALADRRPALPRPGPGGRLPRRDTAGGNRTGTASRSSTSGPAQSFTEFQRIPSRWAYNWHAFQAGGEFFVAHAEHAGPSVLYRWDGALLQPHQTLAEESGRAFASFDDDGGDSYLVVACIAAPSRVLRLDGARFTETQVLDGLGARELAVARCGRPDAAIRVNFILGTPADPQPALDSQVYEWDGGKLHEAATFPTCGGTDVAVLDGHSDTVELVVTNSLTPELRFAAETVRYELTRGCPLMPQAESESPELVELFTTYTASPDSIGAHLAQAAARQAEHAPLLVVTGTDMALYPGGGARPGRRALPARHPRLQGAGGHLAPRPGARDAGPPARAGRRHAGRADAAGGRTRPGCSTPPKPPARPTQPRCGAIRSRSAPSRAGKSASPR